MDQNIFVYAGAWTVQAQRQTGICGGGVGIYRYHSDTGELTWLKTVLPDWCAGQLALDPHRRVLYVLDEREHAPAFGAGGGGRVLACAIDPETGDLSPLGQEQPTLGTLPAYAAVGGPWLIVANHSDKAVVTRAVRDGKGGFRVVTEYSTAAVALFPLGVDGSVLPPADILPFPEDRSVVPPLIASLHDVTFAHDGLHFITTNIRQEEIALCGIDPVGGKLRHVGSVHVQKGENPRYAVLNPAHHLFYVNDEHAERLNVVSYDEQWHLRIAQTIDIPATSSEDLTGARVMQSDIILSPDGRYVYTLYRGTNSIWILDVDEETGLLTKKEEYHVGGAGGPRGGAISPDGRFLLIADTQTHQIHSLRILPDGRLEKSASNGALRYPGVIRFCTVS